MRRDSRSKDDSHERLSSSRDNGSKDSEDSESHFVSRRESEQLLEGNGCSLLHSAVDIIIRQEGRRRDEGGGNSHLLLDNLALEGRQRS